MFRKTWTTPQGQYYNLYADMVKQPHLLIAGATGSGKSVLENALISTLLYNSPAQVQFIFIDLKRIELINYKHLPHTLQYASEQADAVQALQLAIDIMENRYKEMQKQHVKQYPGGAVYVVIDELADLMTTNRKAVQPLLQRIGQVGRAANIHLIACSQCPLAVIIPTPIKVNFTGIVGLRTATAQHSRNIIDIKGCELLPDPVIEHKAQCYYKKGANCTLYNLPMYSPADVQALINYWTHTKPRIKWI